MKQIIFLVLHFLSLTFLTGTEGLCRPCDPTDPLAHNPGNLCPRFPHSSINNSTFIEGNGLPITTLPTTQHPAGIVIQKPSGYWTNVRTTSNQRTVQDSSGNSYSYPTQKPLGLRNPRLRWFRSQYQRWP